ncbi:MAG: hypothetical protein U5K37_02755 [Natrialbaceae archaeon]|nr:hypothetical protein [Natrialbaceae archaeon]
MRTRPLCDGGLFNLFPEEPVPSFFERVPPRRRDGHLDSLDRRGGTRCLAG